MTEISVVIPVYGCEACLVALHQRLTEVLKNLVSEYEIIFVDDCGKDNSWYILEDIAKQDHQIKVFRLSRNFGQHAAITAGLSQSLGNWVVVMDCDLQDPPENIPYLYEEAIKGFDVVLAKRKEKKHPGFRKVTAKLYFKILNFFSDNNLDGEYGSFSIISRKVVNSFLKIKDIKRHYLFVLHWLGYKTSALEYKHSERYSGKSSYSFTRLLTHALEGVFFETTKLLYGIIYGGLLISCLGFFLATYYIVLYFLDGSLPGWTSLIVLILMMSGFILISIGVTGIYIGSIFEQVKDRPIFIIDQKIIKGVKE